MIIISPVESKFRFFNENIPNFIYNNYKIVDRWRNFGYSGNEITKSQVR